MNSKSRNRVRLEPDAYRALAQQVLERDSWRCQHCSRRDQLQIHHIIRRSQLGPDCASNLITLCAGCHRSEHAKVQERERHEGSRTRPLLRPPVGQTPRIV